MAEAVRRNRSRTKKLQHIRCSSAETECVIKIENQKHDPLTAYDDMPLPVIESVTNNEEPDEPDELTVGELDRENVFELSEGCNTSLCEEDVDVSSAMADLSVDVKQPITTSYAQLQRNLEEIEPFFQAQKQLKELALHEQLQECIASAPGIEDDVETDAVASAPELADGMACLQHNTESLQISERSSKPKVKTKIIIPEKTVVKPMTEIQITSLYQNNELEENDRYVNQFIDEERNTAQSEFYQLVLGYLRARMSLIGTQKELFAIQEEYRKQKKHTWVFEKRSVTEEGECEDNRLLTVTHEYKEACFKDQIATHVSKQLKQIREVLAEAFSLNAYAAEMSKLQVENYMQKVLCDCSDFMQMAKNAKIFAVGKKEHSPQLQPHVAKLKMCISVLFAFQRRGVKDHLFIRVTRQWLTDLVAILQRVATHQDHLFLLNHVMRCPSGVGSWAAAYIQIGGPWEQELMSSNVKTSAGMLGCWPLDHSLTVVSTILNITKSRDEFLHHLKPSPSQDETDRENPASEDESSDSIWVVVDSSGEEEEDPSHLWALFTENDVVQILNQVPFKEIFQHILLIEVENGSLKYNVSFTSHHGLLKLFALATCLINLFRTGLATYSQLRYRGVTKRVCRFLRHTVEYVTDHWHNYLSLHQASSQHESDMTEANGQWALLQVGYDQLFERAVHCIFSSSRSGAWQFLAVIPYSSVSLLRLWKIVFKLHVGFSEESDKQSKALIKATCEEWASLVSHADTRGQFHDRLIQMEENEAFYLLTALANMAIAREASEMMFVEVLVNNIFEATFVNEGTREMLSRIGRDLLSAVAASHPFAMSYILTMTQEKLSSIGSMALYLFRALPLQLWEPCEDDITCISHWLLFTPVPGVENQLSRVILTKLNWGEKMPGAELALPRKLHVRIALTVLEAHLKVSREMRQRSLLTEGVKQVTSVMYAPCPEQVFLDWSWDILTCLRLHKLDQTYLQVKSLLASPASILSDIPDPTSAAIKQGSTMNAVKRGLMDRQSLALYSALLLTTWGHSLPEFCEHGADCVHELVVQGKYQASISALAHVLPLFFSQPEDVATHSKLMSAIQKCLAADQTYMALAKSLVSSAFPGKILTLLSAMIVHHIKNYERYNLTSGAPIIHFWMQVLICVPDWVHNNSVLYVMDVICHNAFNNSICWQEVLNGFSEVMKSYEDQHSTGVGISGLLSWLTVGTSAPNSLLVRSSAPEFPWFTLAVLILETQQEQSSGLWKNLLLELFSNPQASLEEALKKVCSDLGLRNVSSSLLSIYRWGQQAIDLATEHPALPVTLQMYLTLHLARVPPHPGHYECSSVIMKFYVGFINTSFLGKIKKKVSSALDYYEAKRVRDEDEEDSKHDLKTEETAKLLNAMLLWLDERRLYEAGVYLPAFPPHLLPQKLMLIFQNNWEPWPEAVNHHEIELAAQDLLRFWDHHRNSVCKELNSGSPAHTPGRQKKDLLSRENNRKKNPEEAILKRLTTYESPQPPPSIPPLSPLHLPHLNNNTLLDQEALLFLVQRFTDVTAEHSQTVSLWCKEMCALDCVYRELLPQLWTNVHTKKILIAECVPPKVNRKQPDCAGQASIVVEFSEARLNEGVNARIEQNREQHEAVFEQYQKPPPLQLCQAAVSLESVITALINEFRKLEKERSKQKWELLLKSGRKLFYHVVQLTSDDTNFYPPAKQLITSCAEILGQEFLRGHADCQESLVAQVLEWGGHFGGLLAPHFTPSVTPVHVYLTLYSSLSPHALVSPDHTFMLLSKFDIDRWLMDSRPSCSDRSQLVNAIGAALSSLLPQAHSGLLMVLELYRVHLRSLLNYKLPEHYIEVLTVLLQISSTPQEECGEVTSGMWYDLMNVLAVGISNFTPNMTRNELDQGIRNYAQNQCRLSSTMVKDTLKMLSSFFVRQRLEFGLYGLYPKYRLHVQPIASFIGLVSHVYILTELHRNWGEVNVLKDVWEDIEGLWAGWVSPLSGRDRENGPAWLKQLTQDIRLLLPWSPSDAEPADIMVHMFTSSLNYMHELLPDNSSVLSMVLNYYSITYAMKEVKSHVLAVIHTHLATLPWYHLHPSLQDTVIFSKVVEQYLPECHSFIGAVLIQINWTKVVQTAISTLPATDSQLTGSPQYEKPGTPSSVISVNDQLSSSARLHQCLLNLLVRISMEPSVRQSSLLQTLLLEAESFSWWLIDSNSYQRVVNWWVMSCDPRIVLSLPERNPVDVAVIQLLHKAAGYTPDTRSFHMETGAKRGLLVRALVRLLTSAAARHKALLSAKPHVFESTILTVLTHMEETLIGTLPKEQQWSEGSILSAEVLALVSGGASSASLQELSSTSVVHWMTSQTHPSPGLLFPLVVTASRTILHLNHRNPIIQAGLTALFTYADWCGWEGEITWPTVISSLSFPLTNPNAMLSLAAQDGHLLVVYAYVRWQRQQTVRRGDASLLSSLLEMIEAFIPNATLELGLVLLLSEILDLTTYLVTHSRPVESIWLHSSTLASRLAVWAEDRSSSGILAAIGLGRQSPLSPGVRLICRCISTFLNTQMPRKGIFRTHPLHLHSDVDGSQGDSANGAACTLEQLRVLSTNTTYAALTHPLNEAIQFIEEPAHCLGDVHTLLAKLVSDILPDPLLRHLTVQFDIPEPSAPSPSILPQDFQMCLPKPDVDLGPEST